MPIILIAPQSQEYTEERFFQDYLGIKSDFIFVENLEEAHLNVTSNKGYFPIEFYNPPQDLSGTKYTPLIHKDKQLYRKYFALKKYIEDFAEILRKNFPAQSQPAMENF